MARSEHDPKLIARLALMHEGNAFAHLKLAAEQTAPSDTLRSEPTQHEMLAASGLVIAASYWSLIDAGEAVTRYRSAAKFYRSMGHEYWIVLALVSASLDEIDQIFSLVDEMTAPSPQSLAFAMVCNQMYGAERRGMRAERLFALWRQVGNRPVGRLGIPLDYYARCAQAMHAARSEKNAERFLTETGNYVRRASEVLQVASQDRFHWLRLESRILPAEPEAVAMTTMMSTMSHAIFQVPISEIPDLDLHGRLLLEVGDDMRNAAHHRDERGR